MDKDIVVIGGGLSGLIAALMAAQHGRSVHLLESASRLGGRALSPRVGGVPANLGAHALYLGGPGERVLTALGIAWDGFKPEAADAWLSDGSEVFRAPTSLLSLLRARSFTLAERFALMRFFGTLDRSDPRTLTGLTAAAWLERLGQGRVRRFVEAMVRVSTYSNAPDVIPASLALRQLQIAIGLKAKGVVYVTLGWQTLVKKLEEVAVSSGVHVVTGAHVNRVSPGGSVVFTNEETWEAAHVIVALPRPSAAKLVAELGPSKTPPARAACIDMVLDAPVSRRLVFGLDEPHYFSVHAALNAAPPLVAHAFRYLATGEDGTALRPALEVWLDRVVPDRRAHVIAERFLPEMDVTSALPPCDVPSFERVTFAGDWASPGQVLLDAVAESAETAVGAALERAAA